tara:strand:+ start:643 stop:1308 length:666 start_codon:yes stop_codon:yes gene_type:complete
MLYYKYILKGGLMINQTIFSVAINEARRIAKEDITKTQVGSVKHLLFGEQISMQSVSIKFGKVFENMFIEHIKNHNNFQLGDIGVQKTSQEKKKDFDLVFIDTTLNTVYYRELKANINLDSEKLPATIEKVKFLERELSKKYPTYKIDSGVLCPSVYSLDDLGGTKISNKPAIFEKGGVKVDFAHDLFSILDIHCTKDQFYSFFKELGQIITQNTRSEQNE